MENLTQQKRTPITEISTEILDKNSTPIGQKSFYNLPTNQFLSTWIERPKANKDEVIPLRNAILPTSSTKDVR